MPTPVQPVKEPPAPKPDPTPPPAAPPVTKEEKSDAAKPLSVQDVDDLEKELELDLENVKIDDNIDTSVSTLSFA